MKTQRRRKKRKWVPRLAMTLLLLVAFAVSWHLVVRLKSRSNAVTVTGTKKVAALAKKTTPKETQKDVSRGFPEALAPGSQGNVPLRVVCYNIAHGRGGKFGTGNFEGSPQEKTERIKQIGRVLNDLRPDIVILNETDFSSVWSGHQNQATIIADESGMPHVVTQRNFDAGIPFAELRFGNAILSRYPISNVRLIEFPPMSPFEKRFAGNHDGLMCEITLPGETKVRVLAVHLESRSETTRVQCARAILKLRSESEAPMIAAGDFNSTPTGYPAHHIGQSGENTMDILLKDGAFETLPTSLPPDPKEFTFPSQAPESLIDWVLVQPPLKVIDRRVIKSDLSDHLPVLSRVVLPEIS